MAQRLGAAVVASHVCAAWRIACLGTPTLWARQIGPIRSAATVFLARSRYALLDVHWPKKCGGSIHPLRIRTLNGRDASCLPTLLSGTLSNLVSLDLSLHDLRPPELDRSAGLEYLGTIDAPRLAYLRITTACLKRPFLRLDARALRSLCLSDFECSLSCLLSMLQATPLLEKLEIAYMTAVADLEQDTSRMQLVELPHLKTLQLDNDDGHYVVSAFSELLSRMRTTPEIFEVTVSENHHWTEHLLHNCLRTAVTPNSSYCLVLVDENIQLYRDTRLNDVSPSYPTPNPEDRRAFIRHLWYMEMFQRLWQLAMPAELSHITTLLLHIGGDDCVYPYDEIRCLMYALPNVEVYWVVNFRFLPCFYDEAEDYDDCVRALAPGPSTLNDGNHHHVPFPRLRTLGLGVDADEPARLLDMLYEVLTARADAGMPAPAVLSLPLMPQQDDIAAARLLTLVPNVQWKLT